MEVPLGGRGSFLLSARRSYTDILQTGLYTSIYETVTGEDINPKGEQVFKMYKAGFLKTFSVGFAPYQIDPLSEEDKKKYPIAGPFGDFGRRIKAELWEISAVPVPSNPQALVLREVKELMAMGMPKEPEGEWTTEEIHELSEEDMKTILPHHFTDGTLNEKAVVAAMGLVLGARGGINISNDQKDKAYTHLVNHYESLKY